jgi:predicted restriction endonuclease
MDGLLDLLHRVAALVRAPTTVKGQYTAPQAPYKPLLLLVVLRRIEQHQAPYARNHITFAACLRDFEKLYTRLYGRRDDLESQVVQPFWRLGVGRPVLWHFIPQPGKAAELEDLVSAPKKKEIKTRGVLEDVVKAAQFSERDWALLSDRDVQHALIAFLISRHFPDVRRESDLL